MGAIKTMKEVESALPQKKRDKLCTCFGQRRQPDFNQ